jgi:hypothetical protein
MTLEEQEAYRRFESGMKPSFSHFLDDTITAGYGELEWCGTWEFPLKVDQETLQVIPTGEQP